MAEFPAMPLFCEPLLADTEHLTNCEMGLYIRLLAKLWLAPNNRFPNDDAWLARKFRCSVEVVQSEMRPLLAEFFKTDGNWLFHKRIDKEHMHVKRVCSVKSAAAKSRWNKEKDAMHMHVPTPTLLDKKDKKEESVSHTQETPTPRAKVPPAAQAEPDGFARWYARYPMKKCRDKAAVAFRKALSKASLEEIEHGLDLAIADWRQNPTFPQYVPHPTTWLNGGRWADEHYPMNQQTNGKKSYTQLTREYLMSGEEDEGFDIEGTYRNITSTALVRQN